MEQRQQRRHHVDTFLCWEIISETSTGKIEIQCNKVSEKVSASQITKVEHEPKDFCCTKPSTSTKNVLEEKVAKEHLSENDLTIGDEDSDDEIMVQVRNIRNDNNKRVEDEMSVGYQLFRQEVYNDIKQKSKLMAEVKENLRKSWSKLYLQKKNEYTTSNNVS